MDVIRQFDLAPRKALGQNFLLDPRITARVAGATGALQGINVVEVGPGPGGLTRALLAAGAAQVVAIERDERCIAALHELSDAYPGRLHLVAGDAMTINPVDLVPAPRRLIANLPYNIGTPLLINWLPEIAAWDAMGLMFQREVAERMAAEPRDKNYGRLAVLVQWLAEVSIMFDLPPGVFMPPPKVTSSIIRLRARPCPLLDVPFAAVERLTAAAFGQRRKMLRGSLKSLGDADRLCREAGVPPTARAEELTVLQLLTLAKLAVALQDPPRTP